MKNLLVAALATLFGIGAASGIVLTQAQSPAHSAGILASTAAIAAADQDDHGNRDRHRGRNDDNNGNWQNNGQCNGNYSRNGDGDRDDQGDQGNRARGHAYGHRNPKNPHFCGYNNGANCQYNGQYNGPYNGQYNQCYPNGGGRQGNSVVRGVITSVNGNQVTLMAGFGQTVTINDQPALDNQATGRVSIGRYVTAYGYYQGGIFYATSLQ